jgi:hypothetical protein
MYVFRLKRIADSKQIIKKKTFGCLIVAAALTSQEIEEYFMM